MVNISTSNIDKKHISIITKIMEECCKKSVIPLCKVLSGENCTDGIT